MLRFERRLFLLGIFASLTGGGGLRAQGLEVTPYVGVYVPTAELFEKQVDLGQGPVSVKGKSTASLGYGARLTYWLGGERFGLEGGLLYAPSEGEFRSSDPGQFPTRTVGGHVWSASARLVAGFRVPHSRLSFTLGGGLAYLSRGGEAYSSSAPLPVGGFSELGGVAAVGIRSRLSGRFTLRFDAEDYMYSTEVTADVGGGAQPPDSRLQNDLVFSLGLAVSL